MVAVAYPWLKGRKKIGNPKLLTTKFVKTYRNGGWLMEYIQCPDPYWNPNKWIEKMEEAIAQTDQNMLLIDFLGKNEVEVNGVKIPLLSGIGFYTRGEWLGRWSKIGEGRQALAQLRGDGRQGGEQESTTTTNTNEGIEYNPLSTVGFLHNNKKAREDFLQSLPVFLYHDISWIKLYNLKVYDARKVQMYITFHLLFHGQRGCVKLERLPVSGVKSRYVHQHLYIEAKWLRRNGVQRRL
eukprot:TRINITY_DN3338_c0_g3_i1.p1 TRINITY_DN3338_c0_g3~~TRINITY_DN3338_c0_g3_i1.p1  ORF type:complete len:239 (-),score=17.79 TRINITY_DN3338_c0_g3_i1:371-1087(-)